MAEERVQKILARAGYGSRRASEDLITEGRVKINGEVATLGSKADAKRDTIMVDNHAIAREQAPVYIALNKPHGVLSEVSPDEPRETVRDLVSIPGHMFIVGRLDLESEGLILMTNDGELANRLTHPRYGHEKEYRVLVGKRPDEDQFAAWRHGIVMEDGHRTSPADVRLEGISGKNAWLRVILNEGRKRQIREMGKLTGLPVLRIIRVRIGSLLLGDLKPGQWRELRPDELRALQTQTPRQGQMRMPRREPRRTWQGMSRDGAAKEGGRSETRGSRDKPSPYEGTARRGTATRRPPASGAGGGVRKPAGSRRPPAALNTDAPDASRRPTGGRRSPAAMNTDAPDASRRPTGGRRPGGPNAPAASGGPRNSAGPRRQSEPRSEGAPFSENGARSKGPSRPRNISRPSTGGKTQNSSRPPSGGGRPQSGTRPSSRVAKRVIRKR